MFKFKEKYNAYFEQVADFLGEGWKVEKRGYDHLVVLFNPSLWGYIVCVRLSREGRFEITDSFSSSLSSFNYTRQNKCTASTAREPSAIARDIKRKLLFNAEEKVATVKKCKQQSDLEIDTSKIIKGSLSQLVNVSDHYSKICGFDHNRINGVIDGRAKNDSYYLDLRNLTQHELIKIVALISEL